MALLNLNLGVEAPYFWLATRGSLSISLEGQKKRVTCQIIMLKQVIGDVAAALIYSNVTRRLWFPRTVFDIGCLSLVKYKKILLTAVPLNSGKCTIFISEVWSPFFFCIRGYKNEAVLPLWICRCHTGNRRGHWSSGWSTVSPLKSSLPPECRTGLHWTQPHYQVQCI